MSHFESNRDWKMPPEAMKELEQHEKATEEGELSQQSPAVSSYREQVLEILLKHPDENDPEFHRKVSALAASNGDPGAVSLKDILAYAAFVRDWDRFGDLVRAAGNGEVDDGNAD